MKKKAIKLNESQIRKMIAEAILRQMPEARTVTNPVGYFPCRTDVFKSIMQRGFDPAFLIDNKQYYGKGFYFLTTPNISLEAKYGDGLIKVQVEGTYEVHASKAMGIETFIVRPEDADKIKIISYKTPSDYDEGGFSTKRISESQLREMIAESIKKVLSENENIA